MAKFIIQGRQAIEGVLNPSGNKNAALPMLAAVLLTDQPVVIHNVPRIMDVRVMIDLLADLGVDIDFSGNTVRLQARRIRTDKLNPRLCREVRSSILLSGPLCVRLGKAVVPPPGGDVIGRRRIDTHLLALGKLGIRITGRQTMRFTRRRLRGEKILLDEASVTATENVMMAAVLAEGQTIIFNAACEPHIQDLGNMLINMGAQITGLGTNRLIIEGVKTLAGTEVTVSPDYIEIASFLALAAATKGSLTVRGVTGCSWEWDSIIAGPFRKLGLEWTCSRGTLRLPQAGALRIRKEFAGAIPSIADGIWPSFPSDLMSIAIVLATQVKGTVLFFEKLFESRLYFVDRLIQMGARIVQCDPHRVVVSGPVTLHPSTITSPDIRAGMALIIAALCARGKTVIENAHVIDRGYEQVDKKLRQLGAAIERVE